MTNYGPMRADILSHPAGCLVQLRGPEEGPGLANICRSYGVGDFEINKCLLALEMTLITPVKGFPLEQI